MSQVTWSDVVSSIKQDAPKAASQIESVIRRFYLPTQGMTLAGERATKQEMEQVNVFMSSTTFPILSEETWESTFEEAFEGAGLTLKQKRSPRCYAKRFVAYLKKNQWLSSVEPIKKKTVKELLIKRRSPEHVVDKTYCKESKGKLYKQPPIYLNPRPEVYLTLYRSKFPDSSDELLLKIIQEELGRIDAEKKCCLNFLAHRDKNPLSVASQKNWTRQMDRLEGWQFR